MGVSHLTRCTAGEHFRKVALASGLTHPRTRTRTRTRTRRFFEYEYEYEYEYVDEGLDVHDAFVRTGQPGHTLKNSNAPPEVVRRGVADGLVAESL